MKTKILHRISTIFAILLVLPLAVISVIASVSAAIENSENDITNDIEQHQPSSEDPKTPKNGIYDGIYRFEDELTAGNLTYFATEKEVTNYCLTNDTNGITNFAIEKGFLDFINNISKSDGKEKYFEFKDENKATSYTKDGDKYTVLNETEFEYTFFTGEEYISTTINPILKADEENKTVTLYFPFYFENDDGSLEITPIYAEAKLVYVEK